MENHHFVYGKSPFCLWKITIYGKSTISTGPFSSWQTVNVHQRVDGWLEQVGMTSHGSWLCLGNHGDFCFFLMTHV